MSFKDVKEHFIEVGPGKRFSYDPSMVDRALETEAKRETQPSGVPYTIERERIMLKEFGRHVLDFLHRRATDVRSSRSLVFEEGAVDWVGEATGDDRIQAQVCRLLGLMGTSAQIRPDERDLLRGKGFSDDEMDRVDAAARRHARIEDQRDWLIGPERDVLLFHLEAVGIAPLDVHIRRLRANALCLMADLLERTEDRYRVVSPSMAEIASEILREPDLPCDTNQPIAADASVWPKAKSTSEMVVPSAKLEERQTKTPANDARPPASLLELVEALARTKTNLKARSWDDKTARQHISTAKLFAKVARTDDPRQMTQAHVGAYISLLAQLPTHWGKSAHDADRSIDEILARVEDLDDDEIGLAAPTINRHRTQLSSILSHMEENGFPIGIVGDKSLAKDMRSPDDKRNAFTADEGRTLVAGAPWTICSLASTPSHPSPGAIGSQFWVFLIAWYMLMRLGEICGLMVEDVDLTRMEIVIRDNKLRRVKNHTSRRVILIPPELIRLGLIDFILWQKSIGHEALFPELHGSATAAIVLFNKKWVQTLDKALPHAREQRKTMHSTRKGGNGAMISGKVMDTTRYYIMGHAHKDVHGKHYTPKPTDEDMIEALSYIPIITENLHPFRAS